MIPAGQRDQLNRMIRAKAARHLRINIEGWIEMVPELQQRLSKAIVSCSSTRPPPAKGHVLTNVQ
jgi:DNA-binding transcriptional regulator YbjK